MFALAECNHAAFTVVMLEFECDSWHATLRAGVIFLAAGNVLGVIEPAVADHATGCCYVL
jgi:hypothetical protein